MFSSQHKETTYPEAVEQMIHRMISAYTDAELAYAQAAANASSEQVGLENFSRYFQARAREMNEQRNNLVHYQAHRSANGAPEYKPEEPHHRQPMRAAHSADEMKDIMRHLAELEKQLEEMWHKLCEVAAEVKDAISKHFAERHLNYQYHHTERATGMCNKTQQMRDMYQMDHTIMKAEMEKDENRRHHCQGCSYYEYSHEEFEEY
ncbi:hypothetical protein SprV_0501741600 [Sparganum proliferum]